MLKNIRPNQYSDLLFDLDGTLTDSQPGITRCVELALHHFGIEVTHPRELVAFVGPPLRDSFRDFYGFTPEQTEIAVQEFNRHYETTGVYENAVYEGVPEMLRELIDNGYRLSVATSKPGHLAEQVLEHFGLRRFFTGLCGGEPRGSLSTKGGVIHQIIKQLNIKHPAHQVLMIGDRKHDMLGARQAGTDALGVLWGYGTRTELLEAGAIALAESPAEVTEWLCRK